MQTCNKLAYELSNSLGATVDVYSDEKKISKVFSFRKRGRPKGHKLTTIGLPAKKPRKDSGGPCAFNRMHTSEKVKGMCVCVLVKSGEVSHNVYGGCVCMCVSMFNSLSISLSLSFSVV